MAKSMHPQIEFAKRHIAGDDTTFKASAAIYRLELLLSDIDLAAEHLQPILEPRWKPSFFEFVSFYQVGFVTCLEWHAKSRLYDLFVSDPKTVGPNDLKGISELKLSGMMTEGLSISHLLAAGITIATQQAYVSAMERVMEAIGAPSVKGILAEIDDAGTSMGEILQNLFDGRNTLVHEISLADIGHPNIRDFMSFDDAKRTGIRLKNMILAIEANITRFAPKSFPNRLGEDGSAINLEVELLAAVDECENAIEAAVSNGRIQSDITLADWREMRDRAKSHLTGELEFIDGLDIAGSRYFDIRPSLREGLIRQRILYLKSLMKEIVYEVET